MLETDGHAAIKYENFDSEQAKNRISRYQDLACVPAVSCKYQMLDEQNFRPNYLLAELIGDPPEVTTCKTRILHPIVMRSLIVDVRNRKK
ncbi:hypothetical protein [Mesorhizobium marinum]|uniref:hypothetical protein n=1 Tax=Mesorhizobium marinum TaxID=3228790 RepID=UPI003467C691